MTNQELIQALKRIERDLAILIRDIATNPVQLHKRKKKQNKPVDNSAGIPPVV
jgi:hypothetical protein